MNHAVRSEGVASAEVLRDAPALRRIEAEWRYLCERCRNTTPFQRPEWLLPWIETFAPEDVCAIAVRSESRLIGFAPLLTYRRGPDRVLAFMGGGVSDYLDWLVEPGMEETALPPVLQSIHEQPGWNLLELTDIPGNSSLLTLDPFRQCTYPHDSCPVLRLPATQDELRHLFSKRQRANIRNSGSHLQRAGGPTVETATGQTLAEFLDDLFRLHTSRWSRAGGPGVLHDQRIREFHRRSAPLLLACGRLRFYRLRLRDHTIAALYTLHERSTVFCYLQGFDPDSASLSPGTYLMFSAIQDAVRIGMRRFDFLRGQESYKRHWRPQPEVTYCLQLARSAALQDAA
ncbi:MAG TPA: GNAT family N-acetyltransferase [Terriglobales bacterium]|nr:GNAT family N-acetyltransferase [Terriglobales bacterium]